MSFSVENVESTMKRINNKRDAMDRRVYDIEIIMTKKTYKKM